MTNLNKIIHQPFYFYNFQTKNWENNKENQLEKNDLVLKLEEINNQMAVDTAMVARCVTATYGQTSLRLTKYKNFWNKFDDFKLEKEKIEFLKQQFHIYLIKDNKKTIVWKEFIGKI